jgi:hypothetical protein
MRVIAPYSWLPHLIPGRHVSEVDSIGVLHVGDSVDSSHYSLSTTQSGNSRSTSLFYTRIVDISSHRFPLACASEYRNLQLAFFHAVCLPPFLSIQSIYNIDIEHRLDRTLTNESKACSLNVAVYLLRRVLQGDHQIHHVLRYLPGSGLGVKMKCRESGTYAWCALR